MDSCTQDTDKPRRIVSMNSANPSILPRSMRIEEIRWIRIADHPSEARRSKLTRRSAASLSRQNRRSGGEPGLYPSHPAYGRLGELSASAALRAVSDRRRLLDKRRKSLAMMPLFGASRWPLLLTSSMASSGSTSEGVHCRLPCPPSSPFQPNHPLEPLSFPLPVRLLSLALFA